MFHTSHVQYEQNRNQNMDTRNIRLDSPSWNQSVYVESDWFYYNFQNILINLESYFWTSSQSFFDKAKASFLQNWTFNIDCDLIPFWTIWYVEIFLLGNREMHLYYCNLIATPFVAFVSVVISTQPRTSKKGEPMFFGSSGYTNIYKRNLKYEPDLKHVRETKSTHDSCYQLTSLLS